MRPPSSVRVLAVVLVAWAVLPACNPTSNPSGPRRDAATGDIALDAPNPDATVHDAGCQESGPTPVAIGCCESLAAFCTQNPGSCGTIGSWPADPRAFCSPYARYTGVADVCGDYHVAQSIGIDMGDNYYYARSTGKLVAVVLRDYNLSTSTCLGGPADFVQPACTDSVTVDCTDGGDASSDAGPIDSGNAEGAGAE